jgi:hypothetical protein
VRLDVGADHQPERRPLRRRVGITDQGAPGRAELGQSRGAGAGEIRQPVRGRGESGERRQLGVERLLPGIELGDRRLDVGRGDGAGRRERHRRGVQRLEALVAAPVMRARPSRDDRLLVRIELGDRRLDIGRRDSPRRRQLHRRRFERPPALVAAPIVALAARGDRRLGADRRPRRRRVAGPEQRAAESRDRSERRLGRRGEIDEAVRRRGQRRERRDRVVESDRLGRDQPVEQPGELRHPDRLALIVSEPRLGGRGRAAHL